MKRLVIYHDDLDGICSAAIVKYYYSRKPEFLPVQYGCYEVERIMKCISLQENKSYDEVIIIDFSFEPRTMQMLYKKFKGLNYYFPQHSLYFFPLPQVHGSLRPTFSTLIGSGGFKS